MGFIGDLAGVGSLAGGLFGGGSKSPDINAITINNQATKNTTDLVAAITEYLGNEPAYADALAQQGDTRDQVREILLAERKQLASRAFAEARRQRAVAWGANAYQSLESTAALLSDDQESIYWRTNPGSAAFNVPITPLPHILSQQQRDAISPVSDVSTALPAPIAINKPVMRSQPPPVPVTPPATHDRSQGGSDTTGQTLRVALLSATIVIVILKVKTLARFFNG